MTMRRLLRGMASRAHRKLVWLLFLLFDRVLPVRDDCWCFATWDRYPHTLDNPRALFEEVKDDPGVRKIVLRRHPAEPVGDGTNVRFIPAESLAGAYYMARSRVLLIGYALRAATSYSRWLRTPRHAVIQLWHGIPLKKIGRLFPGEDFWERETSAYAATVSSSPEDREIMARAFAPIPVERVWLTGLPRNDLILKPRGELPPDYREQLDELDAMIRGRRLVLYAPTWREDPDSLYVFSADERRALERLLDTHDTVLAIRGHSNVLSHDAYSGFSASEHIVSVDHIAEANLILRRTDVLITDYSSIYIDYLILDRPILHFAYDLDSYVRERGFLYDLAEAFGGPTAGDFRELVSLLEEVLDDPERYSSQRSRTTRLFHDHPPSPAAEVAARVHALVNGRTTEHQGTR